ncbi:hypothetical protein Tco_0270170 [Tanacetum coccineum]
MLANYGVANGYQLWFMQNDYSKLLVYCGRDVGDSSSKPDHAECSSKPATKNNDRTSQAMKQSWSDKKEHEKKRLQKSVPCPFREIIDNPWLTHKYMKNSIKEKFLINVSLGQYKRAKACALYDHEGGLVEHYSKLWEYMQAILESNPGRKVIGLDECFLTHTCKGQLLTAIEDLELGYGEGLIVIFDGHKCARHIYANFKRKWSGLQYKRLFWGAASCTVEQQFLQKMEQIKELDPVAYKWLVKRIPNSWCRAFFEMDRCSAAFENGMSESLNSRIVPARDTITPSVRKKLEYLKEKQRSWLVYPSAFREVEVRRGDYGYGVNLHTKKCGCKF